MSYLLHVANVLFITAFLVKDILWLRVLSIGGGVCMIITFVAKTPPMWDGAAWDALFVAINVVQIGLLFAQRRPVRLSSDEQRVYAATFRALTPREWKALVAKGTWEKVDAGAVVVAKGEALTTIRVVADGECEVRDGATAVAALSCGQFVGEMAFLSGDHPKADVVAKEPVTFLAWPAEALRAHLEKDAELRAQVHFILGRDLVKKLRPGGLAEG